MRTLTLLLLALVLVASATTVTFQPDAAVGKDAYCFIAYKGGCQDKSPGNSTLLGTGSYSGYQECCSYIEFTELNDPQYQGATLISATLWLYITTNESDGSVYYLGAAGSEWDEDTITWSNRPGLLSGSGLMYHSGDDNSWMRVNVTSHVQKWLDGTWENYGFILTEDSYYRFWCYSSDYTADPTLRPKLVLSYTPASAVEEATWGQIKADF